MDLQSLINCEKWLPRVKNKMADSGSLSAKFEFGAHLGFWDFLVSKRSDVSVPKYVTGCAMLLYIFPKFGAICSTLLGGVALGISLLWKRAVKFAKLSIPRPRFCRLCWNLICWCIGNPKVNVLLNPLVVKSEIADESQNFKVFNVWIAITYWLLGFAEICYTLYVHYGFAEAGEMNKVHISRNPALVCLKFIFNH